MSEEFDYDGLNIFGKLESLSKDEILAAARNLQGLLRITKTERDTITLTMNKFLAKDHPEVLQGLLEKNYETEKKYYRRKK